MCEPLVTFPAVRLCTPGRNICHADINIYLVSRCNRDTRSYKKLQETIYFDTRSVSYSFFIFSSKNHGKCIRSLVARVVQRLMHPSSTRGGVDGGVWAKGEDLIKK